MSGFGECNGGSLAFNLSFPSKLSLIIFLGVSLSDGVDLGSARKEPGNECSFEVS